MTKFEFDADRLIDASLPLLGLDLGEASRGVVEMHLEAAEFAKLQKARDKATKALDAYNDDESIEEDDDKRDALDEAASAASNACDQFTERLEAWTPEQLASAGAFVLLNHAREVVIERGVDYGIGSGRR